MNQKNKLSLRLALSACLLLSGYLLAKSLSPSPLLPEAFNWFSPPNNHLLKGAWLHGAEKEHGHYALRVQLAKGGKIPPHTHPDTRLSTVLKGTLYVGFGAEFNENILHAVPSGAVYVAPAGTPHFLWAKDGDVEYQENGMGPTATLPTAVPTTTPTPSPQTSSSSPTRP
ncbi:MAG: hypothetical protein RLZZ502_706 [Pseudomonadota bacterium]|jgi:quercetin dioxygenase-like cupin family protein